MPPPDPAAPPLQKPPFILWRPFVAVWRWLAPADKAGQDRQSRSSRLTGAAIVIVLCLGLSALAIRHARPIYNAIQDWYATRLVAKARSLAEEGDVYQAILKAQSAYNMSPENPGAVRLNAEFLTRMKRGEALYFWDKLATLGDLTPADEQFRVRALLYADRDKEAREELEKLVAKYSADDGTLSLAQEVFGHGSLNAVLLPRLKEYVANNQDDRTSRLRLARMQLESGSPDEITQALAALWRLADDDDPASLDALALLNEFPDLPPEYLPRLAERLSDHPRATPYLGVQAAKRQIQLHPARRAVIIVETIEKYRDSKREDLLPLARWLVEEREYQQLLGLLNEEEIVTYQPLLENYLTCLTALNRLDDLERLISDPRVTHLLPRSVTAFYQLHLASLMRLPLEELRARMKTATLHAEQEGRVEMLLAIGHYGEQRAMPDLAVAAYRGAMRSRRTFAPALESLLRATLLSGSSAGHIDALRNALDRWPDNQDYQERLIYMRLLTGVEIETAAHQAEALFDIRPADDVTRLLAVMSGWRLRQPEQARRHLSGINSASLTHGQRIVLAAIARASGLDDEARRLTATIPSDAALFPEERALFASATH